MSFMKAVRHGVPTAAAVWALALITPAAHAQDNVVASKHNLSQRATDNPGTLANYGEVCVYCHTPHGGATSTNAPLWNRSFGGSGGYQMYDNSWSSTIDMTVEAQPTGVSLACLSCHDGTIGLDVITNRPNSAVSTTPLGSTMPAEDAANQFFANLGTNLRNDHPVSIFYNTAADPAFNPVTGGKVNGELPLYSGKVECGTCHNPHNVTNVPFLRKANTASQLCTTCHRK